MKHELDLTRLASAKEVEPFEQAAAAIDQAFHGMVARYTNVLSPMVFGAAFMDWGVHLALSPGKQMQIAVDQLFQWQRFGAIMLESLTGQRSTHAILPRPEDNRFSEPEWRQWPYYAFWQAFLLQQEWWHKATTGVEGVTQKHEQVVAFGMRQLLDIWAPSNFIVTNPAVRRRMRETNGANLMDGAANFLEDWQKLRTGQRPIGTEAYQVGRDVAVTPGKVVFRNRLIELILYTPKTESVKAEPILFVPAWIMKYYILDLSPSNSLVRYLVEQGFTVFMISWHNPSEADRDLSLEDYRRLGIMAAIDAISMLLPGRKIHATGYCLGGTLLSIAAATMARDGCEKLKTVSMIAAQVDFREGGELTLFIDESQLKFLEDLMRQQGFLDGRQMLGAFQLLRSNDLFWSRIIHDYLMGKRHSMTDLIAWNTDTTRMPYRMHSEYLRKLFLDNDLAEGRFETDGRPIAVNDIHVPIFAVGTEKDHIAPWKSVFKIHLLAKTEVTFLLTSSGHNAGIISEIGHPGRHYRFHTKTEKDHYIHSNRWFAIAKRQEGSWWPQWVDWLQEHSSGERKPLLLDGNVSAFADAPGTYVLEA
ncbi:PHA/PHB synthase family protein [Beijerinckia indica]|uniref:Poly-beta-hydroxybutyrate polymerase domain protein n=1 Tax=Beijerinckia indica subsp. indica (strain ATCC 9039 / DSM 1715 / NCIMB 8712) TaxID=395963 RepID=B2IFY0_BEII9|nr:alpha/beta fold hydrolase [Beijerinckia indica]ACB95719.1 Poly-beta-hydroxybutyrate polymerase domain protein [Beijerinckia indica subsp. indica ATCC 9039]